jgi:hypothetical protein
MDSKVQDISIDFKGKKGGKRGKKDSLNTSINDLPMQNNQSLDLRHILGFLN